MATEILLMTDVTNLGAEGEVVTVADGYARNYLLPQEMAAPVTQAARKRLEILRQERETERREALAAAQQQAAKLSAASCTITVKTGEDEKLYGSVSTSDIGKALADQGIEIDRHKIQLDAPIKELGVFDVKVKVHPDVDATVKVWIVEE